MKGKQSKLNIMQLIWLGESFTVHKYEDDDFKN